MSNIRTPTSRPSSVSTFIILPCASCIFSCGPRRWSRSREAYGTFDELFEVLTLVQTRKIKPIPVVLVGETYWRRAVDMDFLVDEGVIDPEDRDLFWFAETAQEIWNGILHWHDAGSEPLRAAT